MGGLYDSKVACIQAKRIYKKLIRLYDMARQGEGITTEDIDDVTDSFTFFTDIIHLAEFNQLEMIDINK